MSHEPKKQFPIAEIFTSPQGEGVWTGTLMTFIRTAGCTVGKPFPKELYQNAPPPTCCLHCDVDFGHLKNCEKCGQPCPMAVKENYRKALPVYTEKCTTYDGRTFECDTDYRVKERLTVLQILDRVPYAVKHICISGGEPFMHDLSELIAEAQKRKLMVHVETSGTLNPKGPYPKEKIWITVSPKLGVLDRMVGDADEIKLLIDSDFNILKVPASVVSHPVVYIQPINYENEVNYDNLNLCLELQKKHPTWRVSIQMHKIMKVR